MCETQKRRGEIQEVLCPACFVGSLEPEHTNALFVLSGNHQLLLCHITLFLTKILLWDQRTHPFFERILHYSDFIPIYLFFLRFKSNTPFAPCCLSEKWHSISQNLEIVRSILTTGLIKLHAGFRQAQEPSLDPIVISINPIQVHVEIHAAILTCSVNYVQSKILELCLQTVFKLSK